MESARESELHCVQSEGVIVEILLDGVPLHLSQRDRSLLGQLARAKGQVVLRDRLMEQQGAAWPEELHNWVHRLRKKLPRPIVKQVGGRSGSGPGAGTGYRLEGVRVSWSGTMAA